MIQLQKQILSLNALIARYLLDQVWIRRDELRG